MAGNRRRVLGVDPSLRGTGLAVVEEANGSYRIVAHATVRAPAAWPHARCLVKLCESVSEFITEHGPEAVAVESAFFARNARTAIALGEARGVVLMACGRAGLPIHEYAPRDIKRAVTGRGSATKEQVQHMVIRLLGVTQDIGEDESDAMAVALCHLQRSRAWLGDGRGG